MPNTRAKLPDCTEDNNGQDGIDVGQRVAVLEERVGNVSRELAEMRKVFSMMMERIDTGMTRVEEKLDRRLQQAKEDTKALDLRLQEVKDQALRKPTWLTSWVLTALVGLVTALLALVVRGN